MNGISARAFTAMQIVADAMNRAKSTNPDKIRRALVQTNIPSDNLIMPWQGVKFDPMTNYNTMGTGIICQIINGEYRTVWPQQVKKSEAIWPMPGWQ